MEVAFICASASFPVASVYLGCYWLRMEQAKTPLQALETAIDKAGSAASLARSCGCTRTAVWKWTNNAKRVGAEYVLAVEAATGVSRHLLRPDLYPVEAHAIADNFKGNYGKRGSVLAPAQQDAA